MTANHCTFGLGNPETPGCNLPLAQQQHGRQATSMTALAIYGDYFVISIIYDVSQGLYGS
jgi:hypothetical protein